ncbi:unnamed protein product [Miscanthus lutarioriparius]|uniref:Uncharacterized protein n=1 Tax=Miscanthus lutarioriparius TaxID=422564 RepID=A0A811MJR7_9POAL|nr:unnamed protein product [Miscanthus lutarioriparius]
MTPASVVAMPRSVPLALASFPAPARAGERRNARSFRPAACGAGDDHQQPPSMAAMPASLRAIQARRKQAAAQRGVPRAMATSAAGCAVAALVKAVEAVQGAAAGGAAEAARGAGGAVAWVFSMVHLQSPDLAVGLLGMVACCLGTIVEAERGRMEAKKPEAAALGNAAEADHPDGNGDATEEPPEDDMPELVEADMAKELWGQIGILHGGGLFGDSYGQEELDEEEIKEIDSARARRRKAAYERIIASGDANSLILSNYAQLLYEFDKDINRAEMYFKQTVAAEPPDGEAMRRYGMFLWHARGDMGGAEDMFTGAIDEEPESSHHRSSYAWFLWMTGGVETCLIDSGKQNNGNDIE